MWLGERDTIAHQRGERIIKYLPARLDADYSAVAVGNAQRLEAVLYPSNLLTVNALNFDINESGQIHRAELSRYTKHYYIGSERVSSALGSLTKQNLGVLCEPIPTDAVTIERMNTKVEEAGTHLLSVHQYFEKQLQLATPYFYEGQKGWVTGCGFNDHNIDLYDAY